MQKLIACFAFYAALLCTSSTIFAHNNDWPGIDRYNADNQTLIAAPNDGRRIVFFGNSITDFWPNNRPEFFSAHPDYIGRGISGQTSYQFVARFREDVVNLAPAAVVILAGINDIAENTHVYNEDRTMDNIKSMAELARANGIQVILCTCLPANKIPWRKELTNIHEKVTSLNDRMKKYADENGIMFVDYLSAMVSPDGETLRPEYSNDGIHPTPAGYAVMESVVTPYIEKALKNSK